MKKMLMAIMAVAVAVTFSAPAFAEGWIPVTSTGMTAECHLPLCRL